MKNLIYLIFFTVNLFSATITLNEARDKNSDFSILHIKNSDPFICKIKMRDDFKDVVICEFPQVIKVPIYKKNRDIQIVSIENKIEITPKSMFKLTGIQDDFIIADVVKTTIKTEYRHWVITSYKNDIDIFDQIDTDNIDFDVTFSNNFYPSVGTLDIDGLPVIQNSDTTVMNRIKQRFDDKQYEQVIILVDQLTSSNGMFSEEAKLFKLRSLDVLLWGEDGNKDNDKANYMANISKQWIKEYPSSRHIPEVLMLITKNYYKLGYHKRAEEYAKILYDEFYDNKFNQIAQIYKADKVYENIKKRFEAVKIYKEVLYNTKDLDIASKVAMKLSNVFLDKKDTDKAYLYYKKVLEANKSYITKDKKRSYAMAKKFAELGNYDIAIKIVANLIEYKKNKPIDEDMFKDLAYWYDLNKNSNVAYGLYKQYLKDFKQGNYIDFVESRVDKLIVDIDEINITKKIANLDKIMSKYPNDSIYKRAFIEKAKIYLKDKRYKEILDLKDQLERYEGKSILQEAAVKIIDLDLKSDRCKNAISLSQDYNVTSNENNHKKFFECLMRSAKYKKALDIAQEHTDEEDLSQKLYWMYKSLQVHSKLENNKRVLLLGEDIEKLSKLLKENRYNDKVYYSAEAYYNLGNNYELMLREINKVEKLFPNDVRNIDLFSKVVRYSKRNKNDTTVVIYAKKIIELQNKYKIKDYSPNVELDYINALKHLKQYDKALKEDIKLLYVNLTDKQKANVLYIAGELSLKLNKNKDAKEFFTKCGEIVDDSAWQGLCTESLKLLDE